jgi:hypothetical protein
VGASKIKNLIPLYSIKLGALSIWLFIFVVFEINRNVDGLEEKGRGSSAVLEKLSSVTSQFE